LTEESDAQQGTPDDQSDDAKAPGLETWRNRRASWTEKMTLKREDKVPPHMPLEEEPSSWPDPSQKNAMDDIQEKRHYQQLDDEQKQDFL
jgi:hypothetical protein